mmetsp:Transcript_104622/g.180319  ORF Transcript_104622/g.180319 Transcript_104622/m.180319 type:complete len:85 (+) Transcript_104622:152-406(+)
MQGPGRVYFPQGVGLSSVDVDGLASSAPCVTQALFLPALWLQHSPTPPPLRRLQACFQGPNIESGSVMECVSRIVAFIRWITRC